MILRLSQPAMRLAMVALAFLAALWLFFFGLRTAWATYERELETAEGFERAAKLEPGNARNWYFLGRFLQYSLDQQDPKLAVDAYKRALVIDANSTETLLELGTAYELEGDDAEAHIMYARAKATYPASADVSWRYGNFLLRQGELAPAYFEIRRAVQADANRAAPAFTRCYRANPNADFILKEVVPPSAAGYAAVIREIAEEQPDVAMKIWAKLAALHPHLTARDVYPLVDALLHKQLYAEARREWNEGMSFTDAGAAITDSGSTVWDGGFESGLNGHDFAWQLDALRSGVQTGFEPLAKHSGKQSLRLGFDGKHNVRLENLCTLAVVDPGQTYLLSGWIRSDKLTSDQGVGLRISAGSALAKTQAVLGSTPWTLVETKWTAGKDAHVAEICVNRDPSERAEGRIRGTAWVDDVSLKQAMPERAKP
jgi:tetratricopeptide (TPR) repeat protein